MSRASRIGRAQRRRRNKELARSLLASMSWAVCLRAGGLVLLCQMVWQLISQAITPLRYPDAAKLRPEQILHDLWHFYTESSSYLPTIGISALLGIFVLAPLGVGFFRYLAQVTLGSVPKLPQVFHFYHPPVRWLKAFGLKILIELRMTFWILLFCGPVIAALWLLEIRQPVMQAELLDLRLVLSLLLTAGLLAAGVMNGRYAAAEYFYSVQPAMGMQEAIDMSVDKMRGRLWEYFLFTLSFILWELGVAATMGLLYIYYGPYRALAQIQFFLDAASANGKETFC